MPPPSRHPGAARRSRSLRRNARRLSLIYTTDNMERVGGKITGDSKLQGKALHARIRWMRRKRKQQRKGRMGLTLKITPYNALTDRRCLGISNACCPPATVLPLLPPTHTDAGGCDDLRSQTIPQSSWSKKW